MEMTAQQLLDMARQGVHAFLGNWRNTRNERGGDLFLEFYGTITAEGMLAVRVLSATEGQLAPAERPKFLRHLVREDGAWAGFICAEAYMAKIDVGQTRDDLPDNLADLPEDQRTEVLICAFSWPTGHETYVSSISNGVAGEWEHMEARSGATATGGRLVNMLGVEHSAPVEVDA